MVVELAWFPSSNRLAFEAPLKEEEGSTPYTIHFSHRA